MLGKAVGQLRIAESSGGGLTDAGDDEAKVSDALPLEGKRVLITRAPHQASTLADGVRRLGATPILIPTIEIGPPSSFAVLDAAIKAVGDYDMIAFTSANAVRAFAERAHALQVVLRPKRVAVVGPATARAAKSIGLCVDLMPSHFTAESLADLLLPEARDRAVLLALAEDAPPTLERALTAEGAQVRVAAAYSNRIPQSSLSDIAALMSDPARTPHAAMFTSASTATNLVTLLRAANLNVPDSVARISIGPVTTRALDQLGIPAHAEAREATINALLAAAVSYLGQKP
jgi:uroporphyrinogen-III synthase